MLKTVQLIGVITLTLLCAGFAAAEILMEEGFEAANGFTDGGGVDGINGWAVDSATTAIVQQASGSFAVRDSMAVRPSGSGGYMYPYKVFTAQTEGVVDASVYFNFNGNTGDTRAGFYFSDGVGGFTGSGKIRVTAFGSFSGGPSYFAIYWKNASGVYEHSSENVNYVMDKSTWYQVRVRYDLMANTVSWDVRPAGGSWANLRTASGSGTPFVPAMITMEVFGNGTLPSVDDCEVSVVPLPETQTLFSEDFEPAHGFSDDVVLGGINGWTGYPAPGSTYGNEMRIYDNVPSFPVRDTLAATPDTGGTSPGSYSLPYHDFGIQDSDTVVASAYINLRGSSGARAGFYLQDGISATQPYYGTGRIRMTAWNDKVLINWKNASGGTEKSADVAYSFNLTAWYEMMVRYDLDANQVSWWLRPADGVWVELATQAGVGALFEPKRITLEMYGIPSVDDVLVDTTWFPQGTLITVQ